MFDASTDEGQAAIRAARKLGLKLEYRSIYAGEHSPWYPSGTQFPKYDMLATTAYYRVKPKENSNGQEER